MRRQLLRIPAILRRRGDALNSADGWENKPLPDSFAVCRAPLKAEDNRRLKNGAKSALLAQVRDVMGLDMQCGSKVTVTVEGKDEEAAVAAIQNYFVDHL